MSARENPALFAFRVARAHAGAAPQERTARAPPGCGESSDASSKLLICAFILIESSL
jgi:hypothetical protein